MLSRGKRILVVCGGEKTEPAYLAALKDRLRNPAVAIRVVPSGESPTDVLRLAEVRARAAVDEYNQVWCVVDVDHFNMDESVARAKACRIELAVSNPML